MRRELLSIIGGYSNARLNLEPKLKGEGGITKY